MQVQHTRARLMLHFLSKFVKQTLIQCPRAFDALSSIFLHVLFVPGHVSFTSRISERKGPSLGGPRVTCAFIHVQGLCTSDCVSVTQKKIQVQWCWKSTFGSQVAQRGTQRSSLQVLPPHAAFSHCARLLATRSWRCHSCPQGPDWAVGRPSP